MKGVLFAAVTMCASCVVMKPITPSPDLKPVAIGDASGSGETLIDPGASPYVDLKGNGEAVLLIRPRLNGKAVGWFALDTGATGMVVSSAAADQAGLRPIGSTRLQDGSVTTVFLGDTFELGSLTLKGTKYAGADFPYSHLTFGEPIQGFCGYDMFAQTVFELDLARSRIGFHDPATYVLPAGRWEPLVVDHNLPHAHCRFEGDHEGLFVLDAGYGGVVEFFEHTVKQYDMLRDRKTRGRTVLRFGGQTWVRQGKLAWFEMGGQRMNEIDAHFDTQPLPLYPGSPETRGIVGRQLLEAFRVIFDYSNRRIAFIANEPAASSRGDRKTAVEASRPVGITHQSR